MFASLKTYNNHILEFTDFVCDYVKRLEAKIPDIYLEDEDNGDDEYRKILKNLDTRNFAVITIKFEQG